jgi:ABC-type uncharacterized transport system YnjBCD substrate-binding protein
MATTTTLLTTTEANVIANAGTGELAVTWLSITNYSAGNATANVYAVPSGGVPTANTLIAVNVLVTPGDTFQLYAGNEKLILAPGDHIVAAASGNAALNTVVSSTLV